MDMSDEHLLIIDNVPVLIIDNVPGLQSLHVSLSMTNLDLPEYIYRETWYSRVSVQVLRFKIEFLGSLMS